MVHSMSESDEERPLTRRELRLREMAAAGVTESDGGEPDAASDLADGPANELEARVLAFEPDISPTHPDGSVRTRREIRELRDAAIEEYRQQLLAEQPELEAESVEVGLPATEALSLEDLDADDLVAADLEASALEAVDSAEGDDEAEAGDTKRDEDDQPSGYSFPDIAPLDDEVSVFDDPVARAQSKQAAKGDFDALIDRAVAQEGSGSSSGTSALILPHLDETGGLTGSLGASGELFVTGSFELPKSLGETGGHSSLIDALDDDDDFAFGGGLQDSGEIAPVSAAQAVSARSKAAVVAEPEKEKSRKPLIYILTGGGLLIAIAGLATWAITTGFFA